MFNVLAFLGGAAIGEACFLAGTGIKDSLDCKRAKRRREEDALKFKQIRDYWDYGTKPSDVRCEYNSDGDMIWNEMTGVCGPASYIP